jgi:hypothetical protein
LAAKKRKEEERKKREEENELSEPSKSNPEKGDYEQSDRDVMDYEETQSSTANEPSKEKEREKEEENSKSEKVKEPKIEKEEEKVNSEETKRVGKSEQREEQGSILSAKMDADKQNYTTEAQKEGMEGIEEEEASESLDLSRSDEKAGTSISYSDVFVDPVTKKRIPKSKVGTKRYFVSLFEEIFLNNLLSFLFSPNPSVDELVKQYIRFPLYSYLALFCVNSLVFTDPETSKTNLR